MWQLEIPVSYIYRLLFHILLLMKNRFSKDNRLVYSSVITSPLPYNSRDGVSRLCLRRMAEMCRGRYCYRSAHLAQECRGILDSIYEILFLLLQVPFAALSIEPRFRFLWWTVFHVPLMDESITRRWLPSHPKEFHLLDVSVIIQCSDFTCLQEWNHKRRQRKLVFVVCYRWFRFL